MDSNNITTTVTEYYNSATSSAPSTVVVQASYNQTASIPVTTDGTNTTDNGLNSAGNLFAPKMVSGGGSERIKISSAVSNCTVKATLTAVGGNQATADGALYSKFPKESGDSIKGGTMGTVAVQKGFLGLTTQQLRTYGTQITVTPSKGSLIAKYGGPSGQLTVSDYGDKNIQASSGIAMDIYRFPTIPDALGFGRRTMNVTIGFPNGIGAVCPK